MTISRKPYVKDNEISIYPITDEDREYYVELYRQINGEKTMYLNPLVKDMMWEQTLRGDIKVFSIFDSENEYCGSLELQPHTNDEYEIGIDLLEEKRNKGIAAKAVRLFAKQTYLDGITDFFLIRISSLNPHSKHVFEKMGAVLIKESKSTYAEFADKYRELLEDARFEDAQDKFKEHFPDPEKEVVYEYKLLPESFLSIS